VGGTGQNKNTERTLINSTGKNRVEGRGGLKWFQKKGKRMLRKVEKKKGNRHRRLHSERRTS